MKKVYVIVETLQDYKGAYTTIWGVTANKEKAKGMLKGAVVEIGCCESEEEEDKFFNSHLNKEGDVWEHDNGDTWERFSIVETELI